MCKCFEDGCPLIHVGDASTLPVLLLVRVTYRDDSGNLSPQARCLPLCTPQASRLPRSFSECLQHKILPRPPRLHGVFLVFQRGRAILCESN